MKKNLVLPIGLLVLFNLISFFQHQSVCNLDIQGIHTWRQSQTMWNIRNFTRHDNNVLNPRVSNFNGGKDNILRYEFPLMQWSIAQLQRAFGEDIRIVRLSLFIIGLIAIWAFAFLVKEIFDDWMVGVLSAVLLQYSPLFYYYTINPIPDNLAFASAILYLVFIIKHRKYKKIKYLFFAGISLLVATLCKLPYLMVSIVSIWYFARDVFETKKIWSHIKSYAIPQLILIGPALAWYIWVIPNWTGNPILTGQLDEKTNIAEYVDILTYHASVMFPQILTSLPIWIVLVFGVLQYFNSWRKEKWLISLVGITFLYLFLELKPIGIIHDYYMFPFLLWIYILVAFGIFRLMKHKLGIVFLFLVCFGSAIYTANICRENWSIARTFFNNDLLLNYVELKNAVPNDERCIILNDNSKYIFSYKIDKMGYVFDSDYLPIAWIDDMVKNDKVRYMYSDSRSIDESKEFQKYIHKILLRKGSIKVIELKVPDQKALMMLPKHE